MFDRAERRDRLAELLSLSCVASRLADRDLRAATAHRPELEAREIEHVERDLVTLADLAEQVVRGNLDVLQNHRRRRRAVQPHLVLFLAVRDAVERAFDDERAEELAVDLGKDDIDVGESAVGDPGLLAVEHEAAVWLPGRPRPSAERIRAGSRFAEAVRTDQLAGEESRQVFLFLRFGPEEHERQHHEVGLCAERRAEGRRARHSLADDHRRDLVELHAAVRFWRVDAKQAERAGATNEIARQPPVFLLELIERRQHFVAHEIADGLRDQPVLLAQLFRREHTRRIGWLQKPLTTAQRWSRESKIKICHRRM